MQYIVDSLSSKGSLCRLNFATFNVCLLIRRFYRQLMVNIIYGKVCKKLENSFQWQMEQQHNERKEGRTNYKKVIE